MLYRSHKRTKTNTRMTFYHQKRLQLRIMGECRCTLKVNEEDFYTQLENWKYQGEYIILANERNEEMRTVKPGIIMDNT